MVVVISGSIGDAEDAAMIVSITAVSDAKDPTMIVITLSSSLSSSDHHLASSHILLYKEIKRDVRQCKGCDDDGYQGTSSDAEDVVMIVAMMRMITIIRPVPLSSWSSSSLIRQHW